MLSQSLSTKYVQAARLESFLLSRTQYLRPYCFSSISALNEKQFQQAKHFLGSCSGYLLGAANPLRGNGLSVLKSEEVVGAWEFYIDVQKEFLVLVAMGTLLSDSLSFKRSNNFLMSEAMFCLMLDFAKSLEIDKLCYSNPNSSFLKMFDRFVRYGWVSQSERLENGESLHIIK
ncbi:MAG: hypothetical protein AABX38_04390 [Candidatus Micrarchaeota archaeon]